jgi:hypothetical protein
MKYVKHAVVAGAKRDAADYLTARTLRELSEQLTQHTKGRQS